MTDAPERVSLSRASDGLMVDAKLPYGVQYLRADLAAARIAALEADLARARERVEALERAALKPAP